MNLKFDKNLLKYSIFLIITIVTVYVALLVINNMGLILTTSLTILKNIATLIKPLLIAIIIAYLLYPCTNFIEKVLENNKLYKVKKKSTSRILSILLSYISVLALVILLICGIYFMIGGQLSNNTTLTNIINDISSYINSSEFSTNSINTAIENLNIPFLDNIKPYITNIISTIQEYIITNIGSMTSHIVSIGSQIASFFIAFVISIYLLKDSEYFIDLWNKLYNLVFRNSKAGTNTKKIFTIIHEIFSSFLRGQLLEAIFVGILSSIALYIAGIDYALIIGIIAGLCNMIPYVGPIVGTVLAAIMGVLSGTPIKIVYAIIAMLIVQQIDNNLLAPKIVGDSVGLHPVFTMLAIIVGGNIGGLFGMLLAVPLAASFRVLFNIWYEKHMNKISEE